MNQNKYKWVAPKRTDNSISYSSRHKLIKQGNKIPNSQTVPSGNNKTVNMFKLPHRSHYSLVRSIKTPKAEEKLPANNSIFVSSNVSLSSKSQNICEAVPISKDKGQFKKMLCCKVQNQSRKICTSDKSLSNPYKYVSSRAQSLQPGTMNLSLSNVSPTKKFVHKSRFKLETKPLVTFHKRSPPLSSTLNKFKLDIKQATQSNTKQSISPKRSRFRIDKRILVKRRKSSSSTQIASALIKRSRYKLDARKFVPSGSFAPSNHTVPLQISTFKIDHRSVRNRRQIRHSLGGTQRIVTRHTLKRLTDSTQNSVQTYRAVVKRAKKNLVFRRKPPCLFFAFNGICRNGDNCYFRHDKDSIRICPKYLRDVCPLSSESCPLAHCLDECRLPICAFYERGVCAKSTCPFLHIKHSADTPICSVFQLGPCPKGRLCPKRHVWKKKPIKVHEKKDATSLKSNSEEVSSVKQQCFSSTLPTGDTHSADSSQDHHTPSNVQNIIELGQILRSSSQLCHSHDTTSASQESENLRQVSVTSGSLRSGPTLSFIPLPEDDFESECEYNF